jgi:hypothetical protein
MIRELECALVSVRRFAGELEANGMLRPDDLEVAHSEVVDAIAGLKEGGVPLKSVDDARLWGPQGDPQSNPEGGSKKSNTEPLNELVCCITLEVMHDPVLLVGDGNTYERSAITQARPLFTFSLFSLYAFLCAVTSLRAAVV